MGQQDYFMILVFLFGGNVGGPFDCFVARGELKRNDEQFAPCIGFKFVGGIFQGWNTLVIQTCFDE